MRPGWRSTHPLGMNDLEPQTLALIRGRRAFPILAGLVLAALVIVVPPASASPATSADWSGPCPTIPPAEEFDGTAEGRLEAGEVNWFTWELPPGKSYNFVHLIGDGDTALRVCVPGSKYDLCRSGINPGPLPEGCLDPNPSGSAWILGIQTDPFGQPIKGPVKNARVGVFHCTTEIRPTAQAVSRWSTCPGKPGEPAVNYTLTAAAAPLAP